jgi:hypothetical protein
MEHGSENATIKHQSALCLKALKDVSDWCWVRCPSTLLMSQFYESMFPMKSEFELNEENYHTFYYIDEYVCLFVLLLVLLFVCCQNFELISF